MKINSMNTECKCEQSNGIYKDFIYTGDCPIHSDDKLNKQNMRERFDDLFYEEINSFMGTVFGDKMLDYAIKDFIESEINLALKEQREEIIKKIEGFDTNEHICRFNDGEQNCDCYIESIRDIISLIKNINIE
jgi:hypothetical protein